MQFKIKVLHVTLIKIKIFEYSTWYKVDNTPSARHIWARLVSIESAVMIATKRGKHSLSQPEMFQHVTWC